MIRFAGLRRAFENLSDRERRLVMMLGVVAVAIVVVLPIYLLSSAISSLEEENREIAELIREMGRSRPEIEARQAQREAAMRRYDTPAPPLASFIEDKARGSGLTVREVTDQPEKQVGGYVRRNVRVTLPGVGLKPVVEMMAAIENSRYPVALERIQIEHYQSGDRYNVQLGVVAYDRKERGKGTTTARVDRQ